MRTLGTFFFLPPLGLSIVSVRTAPYAQASADKSAPPGAPTCGRTCRLASPAYAGLRTPAWSPITRWKRPQNEPRASDLKSEPRTSTCTSHCDSISPPSMPACEKKTGAAPKTGGRACAGSQDKNTCSLTPPPPSPMGTCARVKRTPSQTRHWAQ